MLIAALGAVDAANAATLGHCEQILSLKDNPLSKTSGGPDFLDVRPSKTLSQDPFPLTKTIDLNAEYIRLHAEAPVTDLAQPGSLDLSPSYRAILPRKLRNEAALDLPSLSRAEEKDFTDINLDYSGQRERLPFFIGRFRQPSPPKPQAQTQAQTQENTLRSLITSGLLTPVEAQELKRHHVVLALVNKDSAYLRGEAAFYDMALHRLYLGPERDDAAMVQALTAIRVLAQDSTIGFNARLRNIDFISTEFIENHEIPVLKDLVTGY
ncbi:MAG: hypothetical protein AB1540_09110, partial [Bdellovibrionota bacterium]